MPGGGACDVCYCEANGEVMCIALPCTTCAYEGAEYGPGQSFPSSDGCNSCFCGDDGQVACTDMACTCDAASEWWRDYVATPEGCMVIDFACPANTSYFANSCGCGCAQAADCPEWFNCMPPAPCDVAKIEAQCPYSGIAY